MTVADSIIKDLRENEWVCGSFWYSTFRPTYAQRISIDLPKRGFVIKSELCKEHEHKGGIHRYRLLVDPERQPRQLTLAVR